MKYMVKEAKGIVKNGFEVSTPISLILNSQRQALKELKKFQSNYPDKQFYIAVFSNK